MTMIKRITVMLRILSGVECDTSHQSAQINWFIIRNPQAYSNPSTDITGTNTATNQATNSRTVVNKEKTSYSTYNNESSDYERSVRHHKLDSRWWAVIS